MEFKAKNSGKKGCSGCFLEYLFLIFFLICIFSYPPYGAIVGLAAYFSRVYLSRLKKKKKLEEARAKSEKAAREKKEILDKFKKRLEKKRTPDEVREYKGCKIRVYKLPGNQKVIKVSNWADQAYSEVFLTLSEAKNVIDCRIPHFLTKDEYLADLEKKYRKQEEVRYLAKAYRQRMGGSSFKKNLSVVDNLFKLTPLEFEKWVKEHIFEKEGWRVSETKRTGDGGIDLILQKGDEESIAQCKRFRKTVGEPLIRDFYGTMISEGVSKGYFVTTGLFSLSALKFAVDKPIEMVDRRVLAQKYLG